jgi:hypothetical protein
VADEHALHRCAHQLERAGIRFHRFHEPDRADEATALATEPVSGRLRSHFRRYTLLGTARASTPGHGKEDGML